jgi:hypothetical protein
MIQQRNGTGTFLQAARTLPAESRVMGLYLLGASRSGKSRMLGRVIAWQDFIAGRGQVIFDPRGVTISNFLDKLIRFLQYIPPDQHFKYWQRIRYVEVSGKEGFITGLPLYYRLTPEETLAEISERFLQLTLKSNPHLADAQYFGWPPFHRFGLNAGILCASLGLQITDIPKLISHPEQWLSRFAEAEARHPEAAPACDFFRNEYLPMRPADRARLTNAFRDKLIQFTHDPLLARQFGSKQPGINFEEVEQEALTLLLDFSGETNTELRRFKLQWLFDYFFSWLKTRGRRSYPMSLMIDEFASMTNKVFTGENPLAVEIAEFIQEYLRNSNIWLTVAHQSVEQLDDQIRNTLFSLGTYIFGRAPLPEARTLADVLFPKDVFRVKHSRKVWGKVDLPPYPYSLRSSGYDHNLWLRYPHFPYYVLDTEPEFMSLEEQQEEAANQITKLGRFRFLCRPATSEGAVSNDVFHLSIAHVDRDEETGDYQFPDLPRISEVRSLLAAQSGIPTNAILKELDVAPPPERRGRARTSSGQPRQQPRQMPPPETPQPVPTDAAQPTPSLPTQRRYRVS